jgi:hypothetical protein
MKVLEFYGHSDDNATYMVEDTEEEINTDHVVFGLVSREGMIKVVLRYDTGGVWSAYPVIWEEEEMLPSWRFNIGKKHDYSMLLTVEAPDDTKLVVLEQ